MGTALSRAARSIAPLWVGLLAAVSLLPLPTARADDPPKEKERDITIPIPEEGLGVTDLLKGLGTQYPDRPIVWSTEDKVIQSKKITATGKIKGPESKVFEMVRALLTFQEIVMIPIGPKGYEIWVVMSARELASQIILKNKPEYVELNDANVDEYANQDGLYVATTIKVKNLDSLRDARTAFQRIITANNIGNVQEVPAARAFVVTDFAPNVVAIYKLLREMDVEPEGKKVIQEYIQLKNALAEDLEPLLQDLFTGRQGMRAPQQPGVPGGGDIYNPEPRIFADARTNQIIVYASADDITEIKKLVEHLDQAVVWVTQNVHVVRLKNLEASDAAQVLTSLIEGTTLFGTSGGGSYSGSTRRTPSSTGGRAPSPRPSGGATPPSGGGSPEQQEKPTVVAEEASNSLIIAAGERQFNDLETIIKQIDVAKSQVLIEAALIELTLDDAYKFAVELAGLDDNGLKANGGASGFGGTTFGLTEFADRNGDGLFTDRLPPFVSAGGAAPTGLIGGIFASGQAPLVFRALNTVTKTRVLQLPSIVTSDNVDASIAVLDEQPTTDNTTTSGGNVSGGFANFVEAGTTLSISPHIADDGFLLLGISLEVSGFQGEPKVVGNAQIPSPRFRRNMHTTIRMPDRHTVVLGGLIGETEKSTVDQVPFLGEIPILGNLFKGTNKSARQTSLFLFVTPTILNYTDTAFAKYDAVTCERKRKADELIGEMDIPFANWNCGPRCVIDPATGCVRGSGSASDRLDRLGVLESTRFGAVDPVRLKAEALARRQAMAAGKAPTPPAPAKDPSGSGRLFSDPAAEPAPSSRPAR